MRNFNGKDGTTWGIEITVPVLRKVKQDTGVLLTDIVLDNLALLSSIGNDPLMATDILWSICDEQAKRREVARETFEATVCAGDELELAVQALAEAIADFFPKARREMLLKLFATSLMIAPEMLKQADKDLDEAQRELTSLQSTSERVESSELAPTA